MSSTKNLHKDQWKVTIIMPLRTGDVTCQYKRCSKWFVQDTAEIVEDSAITNRSSGFGGNNDYQTVHSKTYRN